MIKSGVTLALFVEREVIILVALRTNSGLVFYGQEPNTGKQREQSTYDVDALQTIWMILRIKDIEIHPITWRSN